MIATAADVRGNLRESCDVVVVGTGAGGAVCAAELQRAGLAVILVEEGPHWTAEDFTQREGEMHARIDGGRGATSTVDGGMILSYGRTVGGSTVHYWVNAFRAPAFRMRQWRERSGLEHWSPEEMAPYYAAVEANLNVERAHDYQINRNNRILKEAADKLGWHCEAVTQARKDCLACSYCMLGCAYNRKQSMLVTYVPWALGDGARLFASCRVDGIDVERGAAVGLRGRFLDPVTREPLGTLDVRARKGVVVAAGGLGTPALLLRSGIANESGRVGRNLCVNPNLAVAAVMDEEVLHHRNIPSSHDVLEFQETKRASDGRYLEGGYTFFGAGAQPGYTAAVIPGFGREHRRRLVELMTRGAACLSVVDDAPGPGRVEVDGEGRPRFHYAWDEATQAKARDYFRKAAKLYLAAGAREVYLPTVPPIRIVSEADLAQVDGVRFDPGRITVFGSHLLGTAAMGKDPEASVVNPEGESHSVANLWVACGAALPSSVGIDPSLTISSNAMRTAQRMVARYG
ncbi:MAG: GMC family oxidoreductase [bacterium]